MNWHRWKQVMLHMVPKVERKKLLKGFYQVD